MQKVKTIINNEIAKDEKLFKKKLNFYKKNLLTFAETQPKKFYSMVSHLYLKSNLKMINYSKPSRDSLHEQKVLNILKIRGHLKKNYWENMGNPHSSEANVNCCIPTGKAIDHKTPLR